MAGPFVTNDFEHFGQLESAFDTEPDTVVGGDAWRDRTAFPFKRVLERLDRDQDKDNSSSVHTTQVGRESSTWEIEGAVIPAGNSSTPTAPDMTDLFEATFGSKDVMAANTTTTSGSSGTALNLTTGGVSASSVAVGNFLAVDVSTSVGIEVRQTAALPGSDVVTIDRALSANPATGRNVYGSANYILARAQEKSLQIYSYLSGDNIREKIGGAIVQNMELSCSFTDGAPEVMVKFSGVGSKIATFSTSKPTPTLAGQPLVIDAAYLWAGSTKLCMTSCSLKWGTGLDLRNNESCSMYPTGTKRTGNGGKYSGTFEAEVLLTTGTIEGYFDAADTLASYDLLLQLGKTAGKIVAVRMPKWVPDTEIGEVDGQVSLKLSGRIYGNGTDDTELTLGFL